MEELTFRSDMTVELVDSMGGDDAIIQAMLVSTQGGEALGAEATFGRINFLMKNRHGTPFEHGSLKFYMEMPIFVFREFHRHRIGWSYNEMSGRYAQLPPTFYIPSASRPLVQQGKPGHYEFVAGTTEQHKLLSETMQMSYSEAYSAYQHMMASGVAKEVARMVLPVGIYSAQFATCNPRSLMAFLSLRTKDASSTFPSYPMREIEIVAEGMEQALLKHFPLTWRSFNENGRVAP